jgi:hypothetical protein
MLGINDMIFRISYPKNASSANMWVCTLTSEGSSSVPIIMTLPLGNLSVVSGIVVPQVGQKCLKSFLPCSWLGL